MSSSGWTDKVFAVELNKHNPDALSAIIERYSRELFYFIKVVLNTIGNEQDVEECLNDVFISAWQDIASFDASRGSFRTWLTMRARYIALDKRRLLIRKQMNTVTISHLENEHLNFVEAEGDSSSFLDRYFAQDIHLQEPLDSLLEKREEQEQLYTALALLSDLDRRLVYMRYFLLMSAEDMAAETGLSRHAIDTRIWRARKFMRDTLREPAHGRI